MTFRRPIPYSSIYLIKHFFSSVPIFQVVRWVVKLIWNFLTSFSLWQFKIWLLDKKYKKILYESYFQLPKWPLYSKWRVKKWNMLHKVSINCILRWIPVFVQHQLLVFIQYFHDPLLASLYFEFLTLPSFVQHSKKFLFTIIYHDQWRHRAR